MPDSGYLKSYTAVWPIFGILQYLVVYILDVILICESYALSLVETLPTDY